MRSLIYVACLGLVALASARRGPGGPPPFMAEPDPNSACGQAMQCMKDGALEAFGITEDTVEEIKGCLAECHGPPDGEDGPPFGRQGPPPFAQGLPRGARVGFNSNTRLSVGSRSKRQSARANARVNAGVNAGSRLASFKQRFEEILACADERLGGDAEAYVKNCIVQKTGEELPEGFQLPPPFGQPMGGPGGRGGHGGPGGPGGKRGGPGKHHDGKAIHMLLNAKEMLAEKCPQAEQCVDAALTNAGTSLQDIQDNKDAIFRDLCQAKQDCESLKEPCKEEMKAKKVEFKQKKEAVKACLKEAHDQLRPSEDENPCNLPDLPERHHSSSSEEEDDDEDESSSGSESHEGKHEEKERIMQQFCDRGTAPTLEELKEAMEALRPSGEVGVRARGRAQGGRGQARGQARGRARFGGSN